jgi:16S rRNA (cytosine1402-N4)-methyltransferase
MMATYTHTPVLLDRCIELIAPAVDAEGSLVVDATLGLGGHAEALLDTFPTITLLGLDRDPEALVESGVRLARFGDRVRLANVRFDDMDAVLASEFPGVAPRAILMDLGVSSMQLDKPERGFSYLRDASLDMRMNPSDETTAADILATWSATRCMVAKSSP